MLTTTGVFVYEAAGISENHKKILNIFMLLFVLVGYIKEGVRIT